MVIAVMMSNSAGVTQRFFVREMLGVEVASVRSRQGPLRRRQVGVMANFSFVWRVVSELQV